MLESLLVAGNAINKGINTAKGIKSGIEGWQKKQEGLEKKKLQPIIKQAQKQKKIKQQQEKQHAKQQAVVNKNVNKNHDAFQKQQNAIKKAQNLAAQKQAAKAQKQHAQQQKQVAGNINKNHDIFLKQQAAVKKQQEINQAKQEKANKEKLLNALGLSTMDVDGSKAQELNLSPSDKGKIKRAINKYQSQPKPIANAPANLEEAIKRKLGL